MKMIFDSDEKVTIAKDGRTSVEVKKQEISDSLITYQRWEDEQVKRAVMRMGSAYPQDGIEIIENAIILSELIHANVILLEKEDKIIDFIPSTGMKLKVSDRIWRFFNSKLDN